MHLVHYYGDLVRALFLVGGFVMLVTLPMFNSFLPVSAAFSLLAIVLLVLSAGLTNPKNERSAMLDMSISGIALLVFGYDAVVRYSLGSAGDSTGWLFWVDLFLASVFFGALYYSLKTLRGFKQGGRGSALFSGTSESSNGY